MMPSLLFQASIPARYWVEGLHTATYLLNYLPTKVISATSPYIATSNEHFRVFGCACYLNLSAKAAHKLAPRSTLDVFSSDTPPITKAINVLISPPTTSSSPDTFFMSQISSSLPLPVTNDLDIFLQDDSPGVPPIPTALSVPHVPSGFSSLAIAGGKTVRQSSQTAP
jgi:hypothetical protein